LPHILHLFDYQLIYRGRWNMHYRYRQWLSSLRLCIPAKRCRRNSTNWVRYHL